MNISSIFKAHKWAALIIDTGLANGLSDEAFLKLRFFAEMNRRLDLKNPTTFNEKLQWLKLHNRCPEYTRMVDKVLVRDYVADKIGQEYLIPQLGVWEQPEDINFDVLPSQFVLKCNHNSGRGMYICQDKSKMDAAAVCDELRQGLAQDYFLVGREWPYKNVPRRVLAEQYLEVGEGHDLPDYKVMCFHGQPKLIEVHQGRFTGGHTQDFYDPDWNWLDIDQPGETRSQMPMKKPGFLQEMLRLSAILAEGIPHVRVDWYCVDGNLLFGEMTFFDGSGFVPFTGNWDQILGSWIDLTKVQP